MDAPAGWYPDPEVQGQQRYWDGAQWTDHEAAPQTSESPADWYPDPETPGCLRYWDGQRWTEHRAPVPAVQEDDGPLKAVGYMGSVTFDGQYINIHRGGHGTVTLPLAAVQAVGIERAGVGFKAIRFTVSGNAPGKRRRGLGKYKDAATDAYSLSFMSPGQTGKFQAFADEVMRAKFGA